MLSSPPEWTVARKVKESCQPGNLASAQESNLLGTQSICCCDLLLYFQYLQYFFSGNDFISLYIFVFNQVRTNISILVLLTFWVTYLFAIGTAKCILWFYHHLWFLPITANLPQAVRNKMSMDITKWSFGNKITPFWESLIRVKYWWPGTGLYL